MAGLANPARPWYSFRYTFGRFGPYLLFHEAEIPDLAGAFKARIEDPLEGAAAEHRGVIRQSVACDDYDGTLSSATWASDDRSRSRLIRIATRGRRIRTAHDFLSDLPSYYLFSG